MIQEFDIDRVVFSLEVLSLEVDLGKNQFFAHPSMDISHSEDELYYIFASGSTGVPKGAKVRHDGFLNLLAWLVEECQSFIPQVYLLSSFGFDLTQKNIFLPLITGGTLYLPSSHFFDPFDLMRHLQDKRINYINCAPSLFYSFLDFLGKNKEMSFLSSLHLLMLGGEKFDLFRIEDNDLVQSSGARYGCV